VNIPYHSIFHPSRHPADALPMPASARPAIRRRAIRFSRTPGSQRAPYVPAIPILRAAPHGLALLSYFQSYRATFSDSRVADHRSVPSPIVQPNSDHPLRSHRQIMRRSTFHAVGPPTARIAAVPTPISRETSCSTRGCPPR